MTQKIYPYRGNSPDIRDFLVEDLSSGQLYDGVEVRNPFAVS